MKLMVHKFPGKWILNSRLFFMKLDTACCLNFNRSWICIHMHLVCSEKQYCAWQKPQPSLHFTGQLFWTFLDLSNFYATTPKLHSKFKYLSLELIFYLLIEGLWFQWIPCSSTWLKFTRWNSLRPVQWYPIETIWNRHRVYRHIIGSLIQM